MNTMQFSTKLTKCLATLMLCLTPMIGGCKEKEAPKQPKPNDPAVAQREAAATLLKATGGKALVIVDENGAPKNVIGQSGNVQDPCNLCSTDLEKKYGTKCQKAPPEAKICKGTTDATIRNISPVSIVRHNSENCMLFVFVDPGTGRPISFQVCW